ncbi:MAG: ADP compounds hydrolase NudE [Gammaproteobacteria bacterium]|nr:ADP compounds hydrolase NudE [Gammaproteobacteria bacterium]
MPAKPIILNTSVIAQSRLFRIEQLSLEFSNGEQRDYERIIAPGNGAVLIVPLLKDSTVLMVKEYSAGTGNYELVFPKGRIDAGESIQHAANRELREEIGYAAQELNHIRSMTLAPGYLKFNTHIVLAEQLYPNELEGDEPEPLEIVECDLNNLDDILQQASLTEARSIACLYIVRDLLRGRQQHD